MRRKARVREEKCIHTKHDTPSVYLDSLRTGRRRAKLCSRVHNLHRTGRNVVDRTDSSVRPLSVGCTADEPVASIIGQDDTVLLHRSANSQELSRPVALSFAVEPRLDSDTNAHWGKERVSAVGGEVSGWGEEVGHLRLLDCEADGVIDDSVNNFVAEDETGEHRESGSICRRPSQRPIRARVELEY